MGFSGFPKFAYQGCHIWLGCNCPGLILSQNNSLIARLKRHIVESLVQFCHIVIPFCKDCGHERRRVNVKSKIRNSFKRESKLLQDKPTRALVEGGNGRTSSAPPPPGAQMDT